MSACLISERNGIELILVQCNPYCTWSSNWALFIF